MPSRCQRTRFGFSVSNNTGHYQIGIVEGCSVGVRQSVSKLSPFVDRAWCFGCNVTRNASREAELFEQALHSLRVLRNVGIKFAVGSLHVRLCNQPRTAVAGTNYVNHVEIVAFDDSIQVNINEV